jgi:sugar/nucleoside kinase (ribokinase family)
MKQNSDATVMWEIANDATNVDNLSIVKKIAQKVDILSINLTEAKNLLGMEDFEEIVREFQSWHLKLIFLRRGSKGAIMITPSQSIAVPAESEVKVVDPTGGGNSSSGGVLYGYCEGYDLETCGRMGSISAAMCISQYGVPAKITPEMREKAKEKVKHI